MGERQLVHRVVDRLIGKKGGYLLKMAVNEPDLLGNSAAARQQKLTTSVKDDDAKSSDQSRGVESEVWESGSRRRCVHISAPPKSRGGRRTCGIALTQGS
jgi:hypothetical protein